VLRRQLKIRAKQKRIKAYCERKPKYSYYGTIVELEPPPWDEDCICVVEPGFPDRESWELRGIAIVDQLTKIKL
jgi:hypothetical protein